MNLSSNKSIHPSPPQTTTHRQPHNLSSRTLALPSSKVGTASISIDQRRETRIQAQDSSREGTKIER